MKILYLIVVIIIFVFSSCVTNRPYASKVSEPDYNQRIVVEKPKNIKKENTLGISISIGFTGLCGYLGYKSDVIKPVNTKNNQIAQAGNALLGALVGFSITRGVTQIFGKNKIQPVKNSNQWIKKLRNDFVFTNNSNDDKWVIINKSIEPYFGVKNFSDVKDFNIAFPESNYYEDMLSNSISVIKRDEIPKILSLYPNTIHRTDFEVQYYNLSRNVSDIKHATYLYPKSKKIFDICIIIDDIISTADKKDLEYLKNEYPNNNCIDKINTALVNNCQDINECFDIYNKYPELKNIIANRAVSLSKSLNECLTISKIFPDVIDKIGNKALSLATTINDYKIVATNFKNVSNIANNKIAELEEDESIAQFHQLVNLFVSKSQLPEECLIKANTFVNNYSNSTKIDTIQKWKSKFEEMIKLNEFVMNMDNQSIETKLSYIDKWLAEYKGYDHPDYKINEEKKNQYKEQVKAIMTNIVQSNKSIKSKYNKIYNQYIKGKEDSYIGRIGKETLKSIAESAYSFSDKSYEITGTKHEPLVKHVRYETYTPIFSDPYVVEYSYYTGGYDYTDIVGYETYSTITNNSNLPIVVKVSLTSSTIIKGSGAFSNAFANIFNRVLTLTDNAGRTNTSDYDTKDAYIRPWGSKKIHLQVESSSFRTVTVKYNIKAIGDVKF